MKNPDAKPSRKKQAFKAAMLGILTLVLLVLMIKVLGENAPAEARAGSTNPTGPADPSGAAPPSIVLEEVTVDWPRTLGRDPFYSEELFPAKTGSPTLPAPPRPDIAARSSEQLQTTISQEASKRLNLQGTLQGAPNRALINGGVLRAGDAVEGFVIEHVGAGQVIVSKRGIRVLIEMAEKSKT